MLLCFKGCVSLRWLFMVFTLHVSLSWDSLFRPGICIQPLPLLSFPCLIPGSQTDKIKCSSSVLLAISCHKEGMQISTKTKYHNSEQFTIIKEVYNIYINIYIKCYLYNKFIAIHLRLFPLISTHMIHPIFLYCSIILSGQFQKSGWFLCKCNI